MLFDWGIHHFHLGTTIQPDGFVDQHDAIVFAIVEKDDVYMIRIEEHGNWSDKDMLEIVLTNWPHLLNQIQGTPCVCFTSEQVGELRESNVNAIVTLSDGHGYIGRGMGYTTNGCSADASIEAGRMHHSLKMLEVQIEDWLKALPDEEIVDLKLDRYPHDIYVEDKKLGLKKKNIFI